MDRFQRDLSEKDFIFTFELVPGRSIRTKHFDAILQFIEKAPVHDFFSAFSITDNAGGHPALSPVALGRIIKSIGLSAIIHLTCKDKNRNQLESELLALDREHLHNLLILTGDYPFYGFLGRAKPVYDLDSVLLLHLVSEMEKGIEIPKGAPGGGTRLPPIPFFKGCAVSPFKLTQEELWWQYAKLYRKLCAGARFVITQVGFSPQRLFELKGVLDGGLTALFARRLQDESLRRQSEDEAFSQIPILPSILYLQESMAKILIKGRVPGIFLGKKVWEKLSQSRNPEGLVLELSAKLAVIFRKMNFKGVHLCGFPPNWDLLRRFFDLFHLYLGKYADVKEPPQELLADFDDTVVLEEEGKLKIAILKTLDRPLPKGRPYLNYLMGKTFHRAFFSKTSPLNGVLRRFYAFVDRKKGLKRALYKIEHFVKKELYNCKECGDCTLPDFNYLCPQSQCAKYLLNGPCGGSSGGYCEVYPLEKTCLYVRALHQGDLRETLKRYLRANTFYLPPRDWSLYQTSSWLNFYLKKGHFGAKGA